ncbi:MAG: hypothetical protein HKO83_03945 [Ignavibacteriaceae bacterium]|nr:hypothetical protein [Ignavibacteriaceae bacterium]
MPFAVFYFMINIPYLENRKYDYKLPFIFSLKGREVYHSLWKDVSIRNVPESDSVISKYFEFHQYFNEFEDSVEVDWDFTFNKDLIKAEDFALFIEEFEKWDKLLSYEISFKKRTDSLHQSVSANSKDKVDKTFNSLNDSNNVYIVPTIVHSANVDSETIEKIKTVLVENVEAVNDKDIDRAMNTVHKESPVIERSLKTFEEIINNENISVKFFIEDVKVIDVVNGCAIASNTLISNVNYMSNEASFRSQVINVLMKIDDGWKIYQTYHQVDITSCNLYDELGWFYYKKDKYATAIIFYELAAANDSNCDHVYGNLGWNYYLTGDYNKCIENSEKAVQKDSTALYAHYNIALAYLCNGEVEKAKSLYTDVVEFNHTLGRDINEGAIIDLKDLIDKDFMKDEAETILKEIFKVKDIKNPIETNNFGSGSPATKVSD